MLAHDAEPTGSTHVHHSALVNVPEATADLVRTTPPPYGTECLARTPTQPTSTAIKNGPPVGPHDAHTRSPLALRPPLQFQPCQRANRRAPRAAPLSRGALHSTGPAPHPVKGPGGALFTLAARAPSVGRAPETDRRPDLHRTAPRAVPAAPSKYIDRLGDSVKGSGDGFSVDFASSLVSR